MRNLLLLLLLAPAPAGAHQLHLFAFAEGSRVEGSVYFAGGIPATAARLEVRGQNGDTLPAPTVDAEGRFRFDIRRRQDYRLSADTGDGHRAQWTLPASELAADLPPAAGVAPTASPRPEAATAELTLEARIERAVARQVRPLREQLIGYEERVRLHDILGGLGYILGLTGVALWWRRRGRPGR